MLRTANRASADRILRDRDLLLLCFPADGSGGRPPPLLSARRGPPDRFDVVAPGGAARDRNRAFEHAPPTRPIAVALRARAGRPRRRRLQRRPAVAAGVPLYVDRARGRAALGRGRQRVRRLRPRPGPAHPRPLGPRRSPPRSRRRPPAVRPTPPSTSARSRWRRRSAGSSPAPSGSASTASARRPCTPRGGSRGRTRAAPKILKFEGHYHGWLDSALYSVPPAARPGQARRTRRCRFPARADRRPAAPRRWSSRPGTISTRSAGCSSATRARSRP